STPISSRGGGNERVNLEVSASVKARLEREYGPAVWVLDPGAYQMPPVGGRSPGGDEYMLMWAQVLAGDDGAGRDFDLVHFTGPGDMRAFFGCGGGDVTGCIDRYAQSRATADGDFRRTVATDPVRRSAFVRYYALRASSAFSKGAHDEWNIVVRINRRRALGEQVAVFFDGRAAPPVGMGESLELRDHLQEVALHERLDLGPVDGDVVVELRVRPDDRVRLAHRPARVGLEPLDVGRRAGRRRAEHERGGAVTEDHPRR